MSLPAVRNGMGVAWMPASTVGEAINSGSLHRVVGSAFPEVDLQVSMLSLRTPEIRELDTLVALLGDAITHAVNVLNEGLAA